MKNLLIITRAKSELSDALPHAAIMTPEEALGCDLSRFDSFALLGGTEATPFLPDSRLRAALETEYAHGKKFFCEYTASFACMYAEPPAETSHHRLIAAEDIGAVQKGDILDEQHNRVLRAYCAPAGARPLLFYRNYIAAHDHISVSETEVPPVSDWGLWFYSDTLLFCSFCMCAPGAARFAPHGSWVEVIRYIADWLCEAPCNVLPALPVYFREAPCHPSETVDRGFAWFNGADILIDGGNGGVREGLRHDIYPDGTQKKATAVRTDCSGEVAAAYLLRGIVRGDAESLEISHRLEDFIYNCMQVHGGAFDGMLRWTDEAWGVCYQDDAARAMLVTFYRALFLGETVHLDDACRALDFMVRTTGTDGLRVFRTDILSLDTDAISALASHPCGFASAHYNSWYHAALLLAYRITRRDIYLSVARRGLEAIMSVYPDCVHEISQTETQARLIFPLALLYGVTGESLHLDMLRRGGDDLDTNRHPCGGTREWDEGYRATLSVVNRAGECSLLASNGDPVADLLYTQNWLPTGYAFAYSVTGDKSFAERWRRAADFAALSQINSSLRQLDGAWARCFDMDRREIVGVPHDGGWGPWSIESGWTVAELLIGLLLPDALRGHPFTL